MVLVATSAWIRLLAGKERPAGVLDRLLATEQVLSHDLVQSELLIGDGGRTSTATELRVAYAPTP